MTLPKQLITGAMTYHIRYDELAGDNNENGSCLINKGIISVAPGLDVNRERIVIAHEWVHALLDASGLTCGEGPILDAEKEEIVCHLLGPILLESIRKSRSMISYFQGRE